MNLNHIRHSQCIPYLTILEQMPWILLLYTNKSKASYFVSSEPSMGAKPKLLIDIVLLRSIRPKTIHSHSLRSERQHNGMKMQTTDISFIVNI